MAGGVCMARGEHAWQRACMAEGCVWLGACMVKGAVNGKGGICGEGGQAWRRGCVVCTPPHDIRLVNARPVRILLGCILVTIVVVKINMNTNKKCCCSIGIRRFSTPVIF